MADASKTEQPTPRRRQKAREKGTVARSKELPSLMAMAGMLAVLAWMGNSAASHCAVFFRSTLALAATDQIEPGGPLLFWSSVEVFRWIVPVLGTGFLLSLGSSLAQGGFVFAGEGLKPQASRINPAQKLQQMFSPMGMSGLLKSLLPFTAIVCIAVYSFEGHWGAMVHSSTLGFAAFFRLVAGMVFEIGWKSGIVLAAWASVDYFLSWRKIETDLKMTHQEIREEVKENDGNPATKGRIRRIQRQMRRKQIIKATETATVVITNPTHYAVALRYEMDMDAPIVVAKGRNLIAEQIKEIARWHNIAIMENRPLAQALYKSVEVGQSIPSKLYTAVAEVLVMVFRAQAEMRAQEKRRRSTNPSGQVIQ